MTSYTIYGIDSPQVMAEPDGIQQISEVDDGESQRTHCVPHNNPLEVYCIDCCQLMCYQCAFQQHQGHKSYDFGRVMSDLTKQEEDIKKQSKDVEESIKSFAKKIISSVQQSEKDLLRQIEATLKENLKLLAKQKEIVDETRVKLKCSQPVDIRSYIFQPVSNVTFIGDDTKYQCIGDIVVKKPLHPLKLPDPIIVGKKTIATVNIFAEDGCSVDPSRVSISIAPPNTSQPPVKCDFREMRIGEYEIKFCPSTRGQNKMIITVDGKDIVGSPFPFSVIPSPKSRGKSVSAIPGLADPKGIAISSNGKIVVTLWKSDTISIWSINEKGVNSLDFFKIVKGQQLKDPHGIALTSDDYILVTDKHRLQKLSLDGKCIKSIGSNMAGPDPLQFDHPRGLAIHPVTGQVFIADCRNHRIQVLNADLSFSHCFGADGDKKIKNPYDVAFDKEGCIYIADYGNDCIKKFSSNCCYLGRFGSGQSRLEKLTPTSVAVDNCNLVYVTEHKNHCISIFNTSGEFIHRFDIDDNTDETKYISSPRGIAVDLLGNVYVSDSNNDKLLIF